MLLEVRTECSTWVLSMAVKASPMLPCVHVLVPQYRMLKIRNHNDSAEQKSLMNVFFIQRIVPSSSESGLSRSESAVGSEHFARAIGVL